MFGELVSSDARKASRRTRANDGGDEDAAWQGAVRSGEGAGQIEADRVRQQAMLDFLQARVERRRGVAGRDADLLLQDDRARVDALVQEVHGHAGLLDARRERFLDCVRTREVRQEGRMDVDGGEAREEDWSEEVHVPGADDELGAVLAEPVGHRRVARLARGVVGKLERPGGHAGRSRAFERGRLPDVRRDGDDRQVGVEERLQVRAASRDEDADHASSVHTTPPGPSSISPMSGYPACGASARGMTAQ